jgi:RNA polymerase sigma factor (sigma-70 family)
MSEGETEFDRLMERVRAGCPQAAQEVFVRYGEQIRILIRRRLSQRLRPRYDSADFLQSVWGSFFVRADDYIFRTPDDLVGFLATLAFRKVAEAGRQLTLGKYDVSRQERLGPESDAPPSREPTPSQVAIAEDQWQLILREQPPDYREALQMLRGGHTHREIADRLGLHPKTIQRIVDRLKLRLELL